MLAAPRTRLGTYVVKKTGEESFRESSNWGAPQVPCCEFISTWQRKPILSIPTAAEQLSISAPTAAKAFQSMLELGIVRETTGKQRHRQFAYQRYIAILNKGTEPIDKG